MIRLLTFALAMLLAFRADAGALPNYTGSVNKAVAQTIEKTAVRRGFAANDPRMVATFSGVATVAAGVAADVAVTAAAAASAPVWLSIAAGLGAAAVVGGLAYGVFKIFFDDPTSEAGFYAQGPGGDGTVYGTPHTPNDADIFQPGLLIDNANQITNSTRSRIPAGLPLNINGISVYCDEPAKCMQLFVQAWLNICGSTCGAKFYSCSPENSYGNVNCTGVYIGTNGNTKPEAQWNPLNVTIQMTNNPLLAGQKLKGTISNIVSGLPTEEMNKAADPAVIATIANDLWQQAAAQPDYQGVPYSLSDPVTTADAQVVQQANPSTWPSNGDLVSPVAPGAGQPVPVSPSTPQSPGTGGDTSPDTEVSVDLGPDPGIPQPTLESIPTAQMILNPLLNLFPDLKTFAVPSHDSICPKPSLAIFGKTMVMDTHCTLLESVRPTLYSVMAAVWAVIALLIVLRA